MAEIKRVIVFAYDNNEHGGGCNDIHSVVSTFEETVKAAWSDEARKNNDTIDIYDIQKEQAVCSFYLTVQGDCLRDE